MSDQHAAYQDTYHVPRAPRGRRLYARFFASRVRPFLLMLWELGAQLGRVFPETWNKFVFRRFWGEGVRSKAAYFVIDSYEDVRLRSGFQRMERHAVTESGERLAGSGMIDGTFSPQAAAMLTALFLRHTGNVLRIATDTQIRHGLDATLICYGTSDSNLKTFDIEASSEKDLCQFSFTGSGRRAFRMGGQAYSIEERDGVAFDKAIVLRLTGRRGSSQSQVVCAGLTEWGSLAAVHYLTRNWKSLHKRFDRFGRRRDFCVLLEVPCGQFEEGQEIASAVWWEPRARRQAELALARRE